MSVISPSQPAQSGLPDRMVSVREVFGMDTSLRVPAFSQADAHVPEIDSVYRFNPEVTLALLAGFAHNRRVLVQGLHGTGKSTHIEQVAARLAPTAHRTPTPTGTNPTSKTHFPSASAAKHARANVRQTLTSPS